VAGGEVSAHTFAATITDRGQLLPLFSDTLRVALWHLRGQRVTVTVERGKKSKSQEQLGYLWAVVYPLLAECIGQSVQETHQDAKDRILGMPADGPLGPTRRTPSLRDLNMRQLSEYIDAVIRLAASIGCLIPEAGRPLIAESEEA
jgi:hypothetical protein